MIELISQPCKPVLFVRILHLNLYSATGKYLHNICDEMKILNVCSKHVGIYKFVVDTESSFLFSLMVSQSGVQILWRLCDN
jgi:hypothetical protein